MNQPADVEIFGQRGFPKQCLDHGKKSNVITDTEHVPSHQHKDRGKYKCGKKFSRVTEIEFLRITG